MKCADLADLAEPKTVNVSFSMDFVYFSEAWTERWGKGKEAPGRLRGGTKEAPRRLQGGNVPVADPPM